MFNLQIGNKKTKNQPQEQLSQTEPQPENQTKATEASAEPLNTSSPQIDAEPTHFDDLISDAEASEFEHEQAEVRSNMLTQEDFRTLWVKGFGGASMLTGIKALSLPNSHVGIEEAEMCADAIYETILDIPALHFMLNPSNKWLERAMVIGMFTMGMRNAVIQEAIERRNEQAGAQSKTKTKQKTHDTGELTPDQMSALTGGA